MKHAHNLTGRLGATRDTRNLPIRCDTSAGYAAKNVNDPVRKRRVRLRTVRSVLVCHGKRISASLNSLQPLAVIVIGMALVVV